MVLLTKSKYVAGMQCVRYLWMREHEKEKIPEPGVSAQAQFDTGNYVGELAKKLFPDGVDIPCKNFRENLEETKELLEKKKTLFEAGLKYKNCSSRADILVPVKDEWDIVEVKSGTKVKNINLHDVSFQKYCYEGAGLKIRKCYIMHINNEYVRDGELDFEKLFTKTDITAEVDKLMSTVQENIEKMLEVLKSFKYPSVTIGQQCKDPYKCPIAECWDFLPENHIFHLYYGGKKSLELFENGIHAISDIPDEFELNDKQNIQKNCEKTGKPYIDKEGLKEFLGQLEYPLHYLDFETFGSGVPMFDGLKPYQAVPFQFSLHIVEEDEKTTHKSFLYAGSGDPRKEFAEALKNSLGEAGTIIAYNISFEKRIIKSLAEAFEQYKPWAETLEKRFVDLIIPFKNFYYYNPLQKGSAGLKKVLPAVTGKGYDELGIADGETASVEFVNATYKNAGEEKKKQVREDLEKYCGLDTEGMIWIVDKLKELVEGAE